MNTNRTFNRNIVRGIAGLAIAGLAGAAFSAGSVAASGPQICTEPGPNGIPRIIECPPTLPGVGVGDVIDYDALLDYFGDNGVDGDTDDSGQADDGIDFGAVLDYVGHNDIDYGAVLDYFGNNDGADNDDAEPEAQPEPEAEPEVAPEPEPEAEPEVEAEVAPEAQPEADAQPEAQPEVGIGNSEVAPEELPANPESDMPEVETPEVVIPEAGDDTDNQGNGQSSELRTTTDVNTDGDEGELLEAAPVEVFTDATDTDGANIGLYAGILLILAGGGSLAAIAATRRNRD